VTDLRLIFCLFFQQSRPSNSQDKIIPVKNTGRWSLKQTITQRYLPVSTGSDVKLLLATQTSNLKWLPGLCIRKIKDTTL